MGCFQSDQWIFSYIASWLRNFAATVDRAKFSHLCWPFHVSTTWITAFISSNAYENINKITWSERSSFVFIQFFWLVWSHPVTFHSRRWLLNKKLNVNKFNFLILMFSIAKFYYIQVQLWIKFIFLAYNKVHLSV